MGRPPGARSEPRTYYYCITFFGAKRTYQKLYAPPARGWPRTYYYCIRFSEVIRTYQKPYAKCEFRGRGLIISGFISERPVADVAELQ